MRIRSIKPEFFLHEKLFEAEREEGLPLRLSYAGLWCASDREGRFKWEPRRLGVEILPYDEIDFSRVLHALVTRGFLVKYRVEDAWFGCIPSWKRHQVINNKERASILPDVSQAQEVDASPTRVSRDEHACHKEGNGKEGKGRERKDILSGKPDDALSGSESPPAIPQEPKAGKMYHQDSRTVLHLLNEATGCHFREVDCNLKLISARLSEDGVTLDGVKQVIERQCKMWKGTDMEKYLRPSTLFRPINFDGYYAAKDQPIITAGRTPAKPESRQMPEDLEMKIL